MAPTAELAASSHRGVDRHRDHDRRGGNGHEDDRLRFSAWSPPVNIGPPANTAFAEQTPEISKNGLSLYFQCLNCTGGYGGFDIWVAERATVDAPWGPPRNLGPAVNTAFSEGNPALSKDGRALFFSSNRPGGLGANDIYVARRHDKRDNLGWEDPTNLGPSLNTPADEVGPELFQDDEGDATLYFASDRAGNSDIYASPLLSDDTFGPAMLVDGLNSPFRDSAPSLRRDGLEVFFVSERPGGFGGPDIWVATRATTSDSWSTPVNLGPLFNTDKPDAGPDLSHRGTVLYFHTALRPGNVGPAFDLWMATREKLKGREREQ